MNTLAVCKAIQGAQTYRYFGKIEKVVGMIIEFVGPECRIGDLCKIFDQNAENFSLAEVVGFRGNRCC